MRIAISGTHATGKSTLIEQLAQGLAGYERVDEPYHLLVDEGHDFADPPRADDFIVMLDRSMSLLAERAAKHCIFDRCPADYLAYLVAIGEDAGDIVRETSHALAKLDLVVFVPIETPDRILSSARDADRVRRRVDHVLREMLIDDAWGFGVPVVEVRGSVDERVRRICAHLDARARA